MLEYIQKDLLPHSVKQILLVRRRAKYWTEAGLVFIHVPKAAGTSVNDALYGRFMGHISSAEIDRFGGKGVRSLPRFTVVRNPWDRCLSAYYFAKRGSGKGEGPVAGVYKPEQYEVPEFDTFESFVMKWLVNRNVDQLDPIFKTQTYFTGNNPCKHLNFVGRMDRMDEIENYLSKFTGQPVTIPRTNFVSKHSRDYRSAFSRPMREAISTIYSIDIRNFGYEF